MVNKDNVRKWVDALRSGEYQQGWGSLASRTSGWRYCCLGVACEVAIKDGLDLEVKDLTARVATTARMSNRKLYGKAGTSSVLPIEVCRWLGFSPEMRDPRVHPGPPPAYSDQEPGIFATRHLTALNDDFRLDFREIAALIENTFLREDDSVA